MEDPLLAETVALWERRGWVLERGGVDWAVLTPCRPSFRAEVTLTVAGGRVDITPTEVPETEPAAHRDPTG